MRLRLLALIAEVREMIDDIPRRLTKWEWRRHRPLDVGDPDRTVLCDWCSNGWTGKYVTWPCDDFVRLDKRLEELTRD